MIKKDVFLLLSILAIILLFILSSKVFSFYLHFNQVHGMITSFIKFGILATFGEMLAQRIRTGNYIPPGFGVFSRFMVWGFLGLTIKLAFVIFATGTPQFLAYMGIYQATEAMKQPLSLTKLGVAFAISSAMNIIYAPLMMTFHKITDTHIAQYQGKSNSLLKPIAFSSILKQMNWDVQWNFVFKKTIPFFWIPAHTITFLLPADFQVLFAALLSVALGLILAFASLKSKN